jgi:hypothetical protein
MKLLPRSRFPLLLALATLLCAPAQARAVTLQPESFAEIQPGGGLAIDVGSFQRFVRELGTVLQPVPTGGGSTLGALGLELGVAGGAALVDAGSKAWTKGTSDPSGAIGMLAITARRGLPWALELGGHVTHPLGSELWGLGVDLKASPVDGLDGVPDISVGGSLSTAAGTGSLSLSTIAGRVAVSKPFAVRAAARVTPFAGYEALIVMASSRALGLFEPGGKLRIFTLPSTTQIQHRGIAGLRLGLGAFALTAYGGISAGAHSIGAQVGVRY